MDDDVHAELRALQARAYGPRPDIDDDPAARQRLAELEDVARLRRAPATRPPHAPAPPRIPPAAPSELPPVPPMPAAVLVSEPSRTVDGEGSDAATDRKTRGLLRGITWAGSLAVVATLAVALTAAFTSRTAWTGTSISPAADVSHVATLTVDEGGELPEYFGGPTDDATVYEAFFGLIPISAALDGADTEQLCMQVIDERAYQTGAEGSATSTWYYGCGFAPFSTNVSLPVTPDAPAALRERFPDGTKLQFVIDGDVVDVFASDPPVAEAAR